jgi:hypothetical protein
VSGGLPLEVLKEKGKMSSRSSWDRGLPLLVKILCNGGMPRRDGVNEQEAVLVGLFQSSPGMVIESAYILLSVVAAVSPSIFSVPE